jgi:hypothetical protein
MNKRAQMVMSQRKQSQASQNTMKSSTAALENTTTAITT